MFRWVIKGRVKRGVLTARAICMYTADCCAQHFGGLGDCQLCGCAAGKRDRPPRRHGGRHLAQAREGQGVR
eukprot:126127-Prorocentrum_minimum.AAC.1